jgi:hypothetical protein
MAGRISGKRKTAYYLGMGLMILGGVLFASTFVTFAMHVGDFSNFDWRAKSVFLRAFGGMALVFVGGILRGIGGRGLAGSGVVLDPERARDDLEPYSRMAGGMVKDALEEARVNSAGRADKIIMFRCRACGKLNEEDSKFCQECGKEM